jgi:hypothetical protein
MSEQGSSGFNPWPWVPVVILGVVVLANIHLIRLAVSDPDPRVDLDEASEPIAPEKSPGAVAAPQ